MAASDGDDDEGLLRTVTPLSGLHPNQQMDVIGWLMLIIMGVVLLPLLPVILVIWLISKVMGS